MLSKHENKTQENSEYSMRQLMQEFGIRSNSTSICKSLTCIYASAMRLRTCFTMKSVQKTIGQQMHRLSILILINICQNRQEHDEKEPLIIEKKFLAMHNIFWKGHTAFGTKLFLKTYRYPPQIGLTTLIEGSVDAEAQSNDLFCFSWLCMV